MNCSVKLIKAERRVYRSTLEKKRGGDIGVMSPVYFVRSHSQCNFYSWNPKVTLHHKNLLLLSSFNANCKKRGLCSGPKDVIRVQDIFSANFVLFGLRRLTLRTWPCNKKLHSDYCAIVNFAIKFEYKTFLWSIFNAPEFETISVFFSNVLGKFTYTKLIFISETTFLFSILF